MIEPRWSDGRWSVDTPTYAWTWDPATDEWAVHDGRQRLIARGPLRPRFVFADGTEDRAPVGTVAARGTGAGLQVTYTGEGGSLSLTWSFQAELFALSPLTVRSPRSSVWARLEELPDLFSHYALLPGLSMSTFLGPVVDLHSKLRLTTTLGAGAMRGPGLAQQWGLPAHWLALANTGERWNAARARDLDSDALCLGLADLPEGDFWVRVGERSVTPTLNLRSDLWNLYADGQEHRVGLDLLFFVGADFEAAPRAYYREMARRGVRSGAAYPAPPATRDVRPWTHFNTWGSQIADRIQPEELDAARLAGYFDRLEASGLRVGHFIVDDKWEGAYGVLRHDEARFPDFEAFLDRVRARGYRVGLWAAFLRCEDPARVGLDESHLMKGRDGQPLWFQHQTARYGIYDISQPRVAEVLGRLAGDFMRRYRPDLIKFDFGYELPTLDVACPADPSLRGERLLRRGLEVLLGAMKAVNPELVVFYYGLSPLVASYYDLHSTDDMVYGPGDYDVEGNRRMTLSSLLGEVGMPTCSSTGYDWASAPDLWFDAVALGVPSTLLPFGTDENGGGPTDAALALFNGLAAVARPGALFEARRLGKPRVAGGHHALRTPSWERREAGVTTLLALRAGTVLPDWDHGGTVVVASRDDVDVGLSERLGIVPVSAGSLSLPSAGRRDWTVTVHRWQAGSTTYQVRAADGRLTLSLTPRDEQGIIEWLELNALA